jgi:hypothetical protein
LGPEWCQLGVKMEVLKTAEEGRVLWNIRVADGQVIIHGGRWPVHPGVQLEQGWGSPVGGLFSEIHHAGWEGKVWR